MSKRRYNPSEEDKVPIVEKLYRYILKLALSLIAFIMISRENQESDFLGGGFCDDDDEVQERREQISEFKQKR